MEKRTIFISDFDRKRLMQLIDANTKSDNLNKRHLLELKTELLRAIVFEPKNIPKDLITMNSRVRFKDLDSGEKMTYTLVFPGKADINNGMISILAPIGTALIGYKVGDVIEWKVPAGLKRLKVEEILYQPESAGDFNL